MYLEKRVQCKLHDLTEIEDVKEDARKQAEQEAW
jgi:hypothetical protein